jgi:nucleoside-diphosphate-sugar epimerase
MKNILITGGNGYIATALKAGLSCEYQVTTVTRNDFDLTDQIATNDWFVNKYFDVVIHTAISGGSRLRPDSIEVIDKNLQMYYNLLYNSSTNFGRFINIGSGAEIHRTDAPYGLSKYIIRESMLPKNNFYNLRIYAVFDEFELSTRFIKTSLTNYMRSSPIVINQNKYMDFFYMKDFVNLVRYYVDAISPPKEIDCSYETHYTFRDIVEHINKLSNYTVPVEIIDINMGTNYIGTYTDLGINYIGLHQGISEVYNKLLLKYHD